MDEFKNQNNAEEGGFEINEDIVADFSEEKKDINQSEADNTEQTNAGFNVDDSDDTVYFEEAQQEDMFGMPPSSKSHIGWQTVDYTPVEKDDKKPSGAGLRIFCIILAVVIAASGLLLGGYFIGKDSSGKYLGSKVEVELDSKPANTDEFTPAQVYDKLNESIVGIRVYNSKGAASDASGVVYSKDGYIVTNDHIYSEIGAPKFKVYAYDGTEYDAEYVAGDVVSDLAVLKIDANKLKPATFGDSAQLVCGENVVAIGRPSDATADSSVSKGIISAVSRRMTTTSNYSARLIQTDSAINPGSSGGALVNMYGQVIGITASKLAGVEYDAIGFAIPTVTMKRVVEQLIENGRVTNRAKLGISYTEINSVTAEIGNYASTGLYVATVDEESDLHGKITEGCIITHINGQEITHDDMVLDIIDNSVAGDKLTVTVLLKNGVSKDFTVTLRANIGQSSYSDSLGSSNNEGSGGGTFDFPFGD